MAGMRRIGQRLRGTFSWGYLFFLYLPILILPLFSFNDSYYISFPLKGFTTRWYQELSADPSILGALLTSLQIACAAAVLSTLLGLMSARALTRHRVRGEKSLLGVIMLPLVVPELIIGVSLLTMLNHASAGLGKWAVVLGHVLICYPFSVAILMSRMEGFDKSLEEASLDLGSTHWQTFRWVVLPLALPGVIASVLLTFTISFDEFLIAFFLSSNEPTLPVYIWGQLRFPKKLPSTLALGTAIIFVSFAVVAFAEWLRRRDAPKKEASQ
ncbi:MAG TPA: ABC transporter permease [Woeseiaceae bacterium]|nr:ABC transporter permease [Woeseiaceae bacterium]